MMDPIAGSRVAAIFGLWRYKPPLLLGSRSRPMTPIVLKPSAFVKTELGRDVALCAEQQLHRAHNGMDVEENKVPAACSGREGHAGCRSESARPLRQKKGATDLDSRQSALAILLLKAGS